MIISRTPFRVSFIGGGTDFPAYFANESGAVISMTIDKYMYITVNRRFDNTLRVSYSQTEIVDSIDRVCHPLLRETMRHTGVISGVEVTSIADVPSGTGLGSSSAFAVGLVHALEAYQGRYKTADELAEAACHLEIDVLGEPIGKQDQYASAFGGLRRYRFNGDGSVYVDPVICSPQTKQTLFEHLMFFYIGGCRDARQVLQQQNGKTQHNMEFLRRIRNLADDFWNILSGGSGVTQLGELLHESWMCKRRLADNISSPCIDELYERARSAGALGGKVLGAGMGGFLLVFCPPDKQHRVRERLGRLREVKFGFEPEGSKIIYVGN
jgi:D-glycero-alpha-D-manno-heptose-7-phosphate kinase